MTHPMQPIEFPDPEHPNSAHFKTNGIVRCILGCPHYDSEFDDGL